MGKHETSMVGPRVGSGLSPGEVHEVLARNLLTDGFSIVFDLEKSHGSWLVDARTGERVLDFFTFFASLPVGFNHPGIRALPESPRPPPPGRDRKAAPRLLPGEFPPRAGRGEASGGTPCRRAGPGRVPGVRT